MRAEGHQLSQRTDLSVISKLNTAWVNLSGEIGKIRVILWTIAAIVSSIANGKFLLWQNDPRVHFCHGFLLPILPRVHLRCYHILQYTPVLSNLYSTSSQILHRIKSTLWYLFTCARPFSVYSILWRGVTHCQINSSGSGNFFYRKWTIVTTIAATRGNIVSKNEQNSSRWDHTDDTLTILAFLL